MRFLHGVIVKRTLRDVILYASYICHQAQLVDLFVRPGAGVGKVLEVEDSDSQVDEP